MDKELSRLIFIKNNLKVPKYFLLQKDHEGNLNKKINNKKIKFPIVIKPINEGSSLGVSICKNKNAIYKQIQKINGRIMIEFLLKNIFLEEKFR